MSEETRFLSRVVSQSHLHGSLLKLPYGHTEILPPPRNQVFVQIGLLHTHTHGLPAEEYSTLPHASYTLLNVLLSSGRNMLIKGLLLYCVGVS